MGIYYFYSWFRRNFRDHIRKVYTRTKENTQRDIGYTRIDNLLVDMNSILHDAAQYVYGYGKYEFSQDDVDNKEQQVHERVNSIIEELVRFVRPRRSLVLCIDGPAPFAKQTQQRRRRYKSSMESQDSKNHGFESASITPGTEFMQDMDDNLDRFIRRMMVTQSDWKDLEVVFSPSSCPNEGEAKIMSFLRKHGKKSETHCIHGNDGDLFMLSLLTHLPRIYILRDDITNCSYSLINMGTVRKDLISMLKWEKEGAYFYPDNALEDFVFLCFTVGNDFLPHVPSLEILESGIEVLVQSYKTTGSQTGKHIVQRNHWEIQSSSIHMQTFSCFLEYITMIEKPLIDAKILRKTEYYEDELLDSCCQDGENGRQEVDVDQYREKYSFAHFNVGVREATMLYIQGLEWVFNYYRHGVPSWDWCYPYDYAPTAHDIRRFIGEYKRSRYRKTKPMLPFEQLVSVLPPNVRHLLPSPVDKVLDSTSSFGSNFCPKASEVHVDLAGKKNDWEGVVILPRFSPSDVSNAVRKVLEKMDDDEAKKRNVHRSTYSYIIDSSSCVVKDAKKYTL